MNPALRRHMPLLIIGVATLAVGGFIVVDRESVTTDEARERRHNLCPFFRRDDVSELRVVHEGRAATLTRGPATDAGQHPWQIEVDGHQEAAEEAAVDQLLASLRDGVVVRRIASIEPNERRAFGLDAPRGEIAVTMGGKRLRLLFGGPSPTPEGARFVEVEGHGVTVITAQLDAALEVSPDALRRRALVTWEASDLDALALDGAGGPRHLVRAPWRVPRGQAFRFDGSTPEGRLRVSGARLDGIWDALAHLKADAFIGAGDAPDAGPSVVTLTLTPRGAKPITVELAGECPGHPDDVIAVRREAAVPDVAACVPRGVLDALSIPASELVDRHLVGARVDEAIDVKLQQGASLLEVARSGSSWHERAPLDRPVDAAVGRGFLERLLDLQATALSETGDRKALGVDPPRATLRVASLVGEGQEERVELIEVGTREAGASGDARAGLVPVRRVEDGAIGAITEEDAASLVPDELVLRARKILDIPSNDFHAIRIEGPSGVQRIEREDRGPWTFVEPHVEGLVPDVGLLTEVIDAIGGLSAQRWVGAARPEHGLDHPRFKLLADTGAGGPSRRVEIAIGAPVGSGSSFARLADDPTVFVASPALEAAAARWIIDKTALVVDVDGMSKATLEAGPTKVVLVQTGHALRVEGAAAGDAAASTRAAAIRDALRDLVAEAAVSVGPARVDQGLDRPILHIDVDLGARHLKLRVGARDVYRGVSVYYVRREGFAATFAVAEPRIRPLLDALR